MSDQRTTQQRANAAEAASERLIEAAQCMDGLRKYDERAGAFVVPKHAKLIAAHALLSLLDFEGGRIASALENIAESLDFIAARPDGDASDVPTEHERMIMYRALEADYMAHGNSPSIHKMDAALLRFKKLAGL